GGIFRNFSTEVKRASSYEAYDYCGKYESYRHYTDEERLEKWPKDKYDWVYGTGSNDGFLFFYPIESAYSRFKDDIKDNFIAEGYTAIPYDKGNPETDLIIGTLSKDTAVVSGDVDAKSLINEKSESVELTETTDLVINNTGKNAKITFNDNATVNKITVTSDAAASGEAQIVVKDGVTLNVGNGGIVSENDVLTTILVETGGTLIVGTNGIDREGDATPIEIQASDEKGTGVLVFSPNSQAENTKNYAEVDLYTYCKKVGDKYSWQQFAVPVTKLAEPYDGYKFVTTSVSPMTTYLYDWDYSTYSWHQLSAWGDTPFAGYDMTNISADGGVVYTFKGDLIGNQNTQLTLPHKDYCIMGNSYSAPIDINALFEQINKDMAQEENDIIEKTVYKYNAKKGYYEYTTELELFLDVLGIMKATFTDIKPMEGFLLNLQNGNTAGVMLNYANAIYNPIMAGTKGTASAPARNAATVDWTIANIAINSANYADRMTLIEGDDFSADIENGKDAYKYINENGINCYAFNNNTKLATVATDNIEGTNIAFQSAADAEYTLTFQNVLNNNYELLDMQTGICVPMIEGSTYTFTATPNTLNPSRFSIVAQRSMPTENEEVESAENVKGIYTMLGQYLGEAEMWSSMPAGAYVVNGVNMIK
ncbi:MAG: hypothetical protein MJZ64_06105, partial [Paludibacteraceae bacterium]|nr:hypothetical protein [Paludibacteraceae bacterium]